MPHVLGKLSSCKLPAQVGKLPAQFGKLQVASKLPAQIGKLQVDRSSWQASCWQVLASCQLKLASCKLPASRKVKLAGKLLASAGSSCQLKLASFKLPASCMVKLAGKLLAQVGNFPGQVDMQVVCNWWNRGP